MEIEIKGYKALIDDEDFDKVNALSWRISNPRKDSNLIYFTHSKKSISMHRFILGLVPNDGFFVDHINGNTMDNRKCNLRICSNAENLRNSKKHKNNTSGFKGVIYRKDSKNWKAQIMINFKLISLGSYSTKEEAYKAYCDASLKYHGEFGRII